MILFVQTLWNSLLGSEFSMVAITSSQEFSDLNICTYYLKVLY